MMKNFVKCLGIIAITVIIGITMTTCDTGDDDKGGNDPIAVTGVTLNETSAVIAELATLTLTATITPSNATNKAVTWTSSNTNVATVSNSGIVTAKSTGGSTNITVKTQDGNFTAVCAVSVDSLQSIAVTKNPDKTTYVIGESFNPAGMIVTATFTTSGNKVITDYEVNGFDSVTAGNKTIIISYGGRNAPSFTVSVQLPVLSGSVSIVGRGRVGQVLQADISKLNGTGEVTYQWKRVNNDPSVAKINVGENSPTYTVVFDDERYPVPPYGVREQWYITVEVTRSGYTGTVASSALEIARYNIGETGPGGGKIAYRLANGFTNTLTGEICHYLEAAPNDVGEPVAWASPDFVSVTIPSSDGTAIGTGAANTAAILAVDVNAPAALACANYQGGGKSDWFLPSMDELNQLYVNRVAIGGLITVRYESYYHSSSSSLSNFLGIPRIFGQYFYNGEQSEGYEKTEMLRVRPVRYF